MDGGPWTMEGEAIMFQKWELGMTCEDFVNTKEFAKGFATYAGDVTKTTSNNREGSYEGEYMKFRIELDTHKPILPGLFFQRIGRKRTWVSMKYERLQCLLQVWKIKSRDEGV